MVSWRTVIYLTLAAIVTSSATALAQTGAASTALVSEAIRTLWYGAKLNIQESANQMPETEYGFRPTPQVRTFGQILAHIAGANYVFCSAAKGERHPHAEDDFEKTVTTKAAIVKALNESLAYCDAAYDTLTDAAAVQVVTLPFDGGQGIRVLPLMENTTHLNEHYGNLITYFESGVWYPRRPFASGNGSTALLHHARACSSATFPDVLWTLRVVRLPR